MSLWQTIKDRMFDRTNAGKVSRDGHGAARWLDDPILNAALAEVRGAVVDAWMISRDPEARERAWLMLHQSNAFTGALEAAMHRMQLQDKQSQ